MSLSLINDVENNDIQDKNEIQKEIEDTGNKNDEIAFKIMSNDIETGINKHDIEKVYLEDGNEYSDNALLIDMSEKRIVTESLLIGIRDILNYMENYSESADGVESETDEEMGVYMKTQKGVRRLGKAKKFNMQQYGIGALKLLLGNEVVLYTHYTGDKQFTKHKTGIKEIKLRLR